MKVGACAPVGLSSEYLARKPAPSPVAPPVWYISTALYNGNLPILCVGYTDNDIADYETEVVTGLLARLPHRVMYKPYPALRYMDEDPVLACAAEQPNISIYEDRLDLRYIASEARVFVTGRATSTMSWCLFSGRPTVFIDHPDQVPLRPETRDAMREAAFLIDARKPGWKEEAVTLLSQPIERLEAVWKEKEAARREFTARFFSAWPDGRGGRRAAEIIKNHIKGTQGSR
jgi:hypothetical protein